MDLTKDLEDLSYFLKELFLEVNEVNIKIDSYFTTPSGMPPIFLQL